MLTSNFHTTTTHIFTPFAILIQYYEVAKENDVLLSINDIDVDSYCSVTEQVSKYNPADTVRLEIKRRSKKQIFNLELQ